MDRTGELRRIVSRLEVRLASIADTLAEVRRELDGLLPAACANHDHTPSGGCVCPACGMVLPAGLADDYRERHLRAPHERCEDCGKSFVVLATHRARIHGRESGGPTSSSPT